MKVSKARRAEHRELILSGASHQFRDKGFEGVTVAELMRDVGLTHGGFYNHVESKEQLFTLSARRAFEELTRHWNWLCEKNPADSLQAIVKGYLSHKHYRDPGSGCIVAAIGIETARQASPVKTVMTGGVEDMLKIFEGVSSGRTQKQRRKNAVTALSQMVGAMVLARSNSDESLATEILSTVSASLTNSSHIH